MWTVSKISCFTAIFAILAACSSNPSSGDDDDNDNDDNDNDNDTSSTARGGTKSSSTSTNNGTDTGSDTGTTTGSGGREVVTATGGTTSVATRTGGTTAVTTSGGRTGGTTAVTTSGGRTGGTTSTAKGGTTSTTTTGGASSTAKGGTTSTAKGGSTSTAAGGTSSSTGDGGADPGATGGESSIGGQCANVEAATSAKPVVLEFVIDKSGSFNTDAYPTDTANNATKWQEVQRVIPEALGRLPDTWAVGTTYFSLSGNTSDLASCYAGSQAAPIAQVTAEHIQEIVDSMPTEGAGATPTFAAWKFGLEQLQNWSAPTEYAESPRYVVLITDGIPTVKANGCYGAVTCPVAGVDYWTAPTCPDGQVVRSNGAYAIYETEYDRQIAMVKSLGEAAGIKTYVVGVLGSQDPQGADYDPLFKLSQWADAGGTTAAGCVTASGAVNADGSAISARGTYCHMDMTVDEDFAGGLSRALKAIVTSTVGCTYGVPKPVIDRPINFESGTKVTYYPGGSDATDPNAGVALPQNKVGETEPGCTTDDPATSGIGWHYSKWNEFLEPTELELCPSSCAQIKNDLDAQLKVTFECVEVV